MSIPELCKLLDLGIPVPIGLEYKSGGHICCAVGRNAQTGAFLIHDSYGIRAGATDEWVVIFDGGSGYSGGGAYDPCSPTVMDVLWQSQQGPSSGWARVTTAFKDPKTGRRIETGAPKGL